MPHSTHAKFTSINRLLAASSLVLFCSLFQTADSHGFLLQPMGRAFVSYKFDPYETKDYNPQGANAGGKQKVYDNGRLHWPNGRFGMCGDPWDAPKKRLEQPGRTTASYAPGSTISIHLVITANHWGRMEFSLCPKDATSKDFAQLCTVLQRADGKGPHWTLPPGELPDPQGRPLIPKYTDASFTYYIYPENDDFRDTPVYVVKYVLPAGFKCEACVLRWYWLTGNACNPPCEKSDPLYPNCNRLSMGYCGDAKALSPEEFWGCSDIHIGDSSTKAPHVNSSMDQLLEHLRSAQEAEEKLGHPTTPALPNVADYWRPELLAANEGLDATYHHGPPVMDTPVGNRPSVGSAGDAASDASLGGAHPEMTGGDATVPAEVDVSGELHSVGEVLPTAAVQVP